MLKYHEIGSVETHPQCNKRLADHFTQPAICLGIMGVRTIHNYTIYIPFDIEDIK